MRDTIHAEPLGTERKIYVSAAHTFGTDAFLLAAFARPCRNDRAADLGTGCGIIPSLWLGKDSVRSAVGIEISQEACQLARRTAEENGDADRFAVVNIDLRELAGSEIPREQFDLVVCNPPYFTEGAGYLPPDSERARARSELQCSIDDVCAAAKYLVRYGGRFCVCHRPERLADVICAMRGQGFEPKRMRTVHQRPEKPAWLVLLEGRRGGKPSLEMMPPLYMLDKNGQSSPEIEEMYGDYRAGRGQS